MAIRRLGYVLKPLWVLFTALSTLACGREPAKRLELNEFAPYVQQFEALGAEYGRPVFVDNLIIRRVETQEEMGNPNAIGICLTSPSRTPEIKILGRFWDKAPELAQEQVMFHELGHCVLNRPHVEYVLPCDGVYAQRFGTRAGSLMGKYQIPTIIYEVFRDQYLFELFNPGAV